MAIILRLLLLLGSVLTAASQLYNISSNPHINAIEHLELLPTRIVNGVRISCQRAPYQAALRYEGQFICGGSILSRYWILTAAHCVDGQRGRYRVRVGSTQQPRGGQLHRVKSVVMHANYNRRSMQNDLALLRLATPLSYGRCVQPVRLPSSSKRQAPPRCLLVSGWGLRKETAQNVQRYLRATSVCRVSASRCDRMYRRGGVRIYRQMLCAQRLGHDSCSGDSGGPLASGRTLYGVVSFGIGCANRNYPGVYVNVKRYNGWIRSVIERYS
ncbi:trypsin beta-like [Drosophila hydei]|uniref:Trypsin beta-like n=1 Tax=Drosophila hydei TaxID=7224 RepID=A0A6J1LBF1_DROHY|nr:trypsin beta-like [Drosophila hydei]